MSTFEPPTQGELVGPPPALVAHGKTATMGYLSEKSQAERVSAAREMWTRGILDPAAPGVVYFPSMSEISRMTELTKTTLERHRTSGEWDVDRDRNMAAMNVGMMAAVEPSEKAVERAERMHSNMRRLDDRAVEIASQGMEIASKMLVEMAESGDGNAGKLHKLASSLEVFHKVGKAACNPSVSEGAGSAPTINLNLNTISASEEIVASVAKIYVDLEQKAREKAERKHNTIPGEVEL